MKILLILLIFNSIILNIAICQKNKPFIELKSIEPDFNDNNDLKSLDSIIGNRKIIGMGESTHGTSEFTTMRHRLFKYLVENHGYNTFFLEADFAACQRVNRYIHGETDSVNLALKEIKLWPWRTEEMKLMIEWMRIYNSTHDKKITFVGCDMQLIEDDFIELERFFKKHNPINTFQFITLNSTSQPFEKSKILDEKTRWNQFTLNFNENTLHSNDLINYKMLKQGIDQWFEYNLNPSPSFNYRDSCMALNIISYLELNPDSKGFYFAHNFHVSKAIHIYSKNKEYAKKVTGRYLLEKYDTSYFVILQDMNQGSFNAYNYKDKEYNFEVFNLEPSKSNSISHYYNKFNTPVLFSTHFSKKKNIQITLIGSVYEKSKFSKKHGRYTEFSVDFFDAFLFIKDTHQTKVIWD